MDTGTSTSVLSARDLENRGLDTTKDVLANAPNIVFVGTGNIAPAIRGVDSTGASQGPDAFIAGSRPRFNMQLDGRPLGYNDIIFCDIELRDATGRAHVCTPVPNANIVCRLPLGTKKV